MDDRLEKIKYAIARWISSDLTLSVYPGTKPDIFILRLEKGMCRVEKYCLWTREGGILDKKSDMAKQLARELVFSLASELWLMKKDVVITEKVKIYVETRRENI